MIRSTGGRLALVALCLVACDDADDATATDATTPPIADAAPIADAGPDAAASEDAGPDAGPPALAYTPCDEGARVGRFEVALAADYTSVQGQVADAVAPYQVPVVTASSGGCRLLQPPTLFCETPCEGGETCGPDNTCVPLPGNVDVGPVTVQGLTAPVDMTATEPVWFYSYRGDLPHPGFAPGDAITLEAGGAGDVAAFTLRGVGVPALEVPTETVPLEMGAAVALRWAPSEGPAWVHAELNIANHGGTPAWILCDVPDTGAFDVPVALTDQLLGFGFSGFPSVVLTRRTADAVETANGCVEMLISSTRVLDLEIPGLTSCSSDDDCPEPQTCQLDLTCN